VLASGRKWKEVEKFEAQYLCEVDSANQINEFVVDMTLMNYQVVTRGFEDPCFQNRYILKLLNKCEIKKEKNIPHVALLGYSLRVCVLSLPDRLRFGVVGAKIPGHCVRKCTRFVAELSECVPMRRRRLRPESWIAFDSVRRNTVMEGQRARRSL